MSAEPSQTNDGSMPREDTTQPETPNKTTGFDLGVIRNILEQDFDPELRGVNNSDVDWFLRDSNIHPSGSSTKSKVELNPHLEFGKTANIPEVPNASILSLVLSHLTTTISNTNENNATKTKPSISPIQEESSELFLLPPVRELLSSPSFSKRRSSVSSINSVGSASSSNSTSGGFFSKLKVRISLKKEITSTPSSPKPVSKPIFKEDYNMNRVSTPHSPTSAKSPIERQSSLNNDYKLTRTVSTPNYSDPNAILDPKLSEYVKFYQKKDLRSSTSTGRTSRRGSSTLFHTANTISEEIIPEHPSKSPLPSALLNPYDVSPVIKPVQEEPSGGRFSSFLRRRSTTNPTPSQEHVVPETVRSKSNSITTIQSSEPELPEFAGLKPLKRVAFHSSTFLIDPPQQIPSRHPRKGNVEVLPNGVVRINPLTEEEKKLVEKSQKGLGGGLVVGGTGALGYIKKPKKEEEDPQESEEDPAIDKHAKLLAIDKPIIPARAPPSAPPVEKMALDLMYTRCCHLREILPIPAILKQIPKGSMAPLPIIQLRNPCPTNVEIDTFADFIRIAPIICVSLDGVCFSLDQFKTLLSAMSAKRQLEKLSLRNTPISAAGWSLLCWFLSRNTVLQKLDITQCPSLSVNLLKRKKKPEKENDIERMSCNKENRSDMDWSLFTATLVARGGIEELILTGCCITDLEVFEKFIRHAVLIKTNRLGLAYNQLSFQQVRVVLETWLLLDFVRGLDLGYNDFSSIKYVQTFLDLKSNPDIEKKLHQSPLSFLSLNATNQRFSNEFKDLLETFLMKFSNLKYLDLSNNPKLFGSPSLEKATENSPYKDYTQEAIISYFTSKFPLFPKLIRLHLENNQLSSSSLVAIAQVIPFCKNLGYLSVVGNNTDVTAGAALIQALKNSRTLITLDCDYDEFPDFFKERIGLYTMRNMERLLGSTPGNLSDADSQTSSLTEQLNELLARKAEDKLDLNSPEVVKFVQKAYSIRAELRATIDELFKLQWGNKLNLEGKETLIRFLFIDASIVKGLQLIDASLDKRDLTQDLSNFVMIGASEDEKNRYKIKQDEVRLEEILTGLLESDITLGQSPMSLSRSQSKTSLNNLDREEGLMMKMTKLHEFHAPTPILSHFESLSGEEIRQKLLKVDMSDLDKIVEVLDSLKSKGISLREFYQDGNADFGAQVKNQEDKHLDEIRRRLHKLAMLEKERDQSTPQDLDRIDPRPAHAPDGETIRQLYDEVLKDLNLPS